MDGYGIRKRPIPPSGFLKNRVENILFAPVVLVQRRRFDTHGVRNLLNTYCVVPLLGKQAQSFQKDSLFGMRRTTPLLG